MCSADNNEPGSMRPGDCFTIEPALIQGPDAEAFMWDDGWTMSTLVSHLGSEPLVSTDFDAVWGEERPVRAPDTHHGGWSRCLD